MVGTWEVTTKTTFFVRNDLDDLMGDEFTIDIEYAVDPGMDTEASQDS